MLTFIFRFLFCSYGNQIRVYSVKTGELVSIFKGHTGEVSDLCLSERNPLQVNIIIILTILSENHIQ